MPTELPQPPLVSQTLSNLLGRDVGVKRASAPLVPGPRAPVTVATFVNADGAAQVLCVCDVAAAASVGAALSMIPPALANECVKKGVLDPGVRENLHEVMNVGAAMLSGSGTRLALRDLFVPPDALPAEIKQFLARPPARADFELTVSGYPPGKMAIVAR